MIKYAQDKIAYLLKSLTKFTKHSVIVVLNKTIKYSNIKTLNHVVLIVFKVLNSTCTTQVRANFGMGVDRGPWMSAPPPPLSSVVFCVREVKNPNPPPPSPPLHSGIRWKSAPWCSCPAHCHNTSIIKLSLCYELIWDKKKWNDA